MKIGSFQNIAGVEPQSLKKQLRKRERNGQVEDTTLQKSDTVSVNEGVDIENVVKEQIQLQSVDATRIQKIKEAITSGKYSVDIHKISES
ncbi:flagellar biosynthesis anti-sigma factor FlgM, partial [Desulfurobacterium sp.]